MASNPPAEWPDEVKNDYEPLRVIGRGGFASVWMAKEKKSSGDNGDQVAIKIVKDDGYAKREISILSELSSKYPHPHPNIVRLIRSFESQVDASKNHNSVGIILSLARGPTLNFIINKNGALGLIMAQSISRQLIDAVAFLHGHAVIHRDIQPCNVIVSGAMINDDLWWSDDLDVDGKVLKMSKQCRITLVDFGFARALTPDNIESDEGLRKAMAESSKEDDRETDDSIAEMAIVDPSDANQRKKRFDAYTVTQALNDDSVTTQTRGRSRVQDNLETSISHVRVRDLSALGTRNYAAPEIMAGIRKIADTLGDSIRSRSDYKHSKEALGECVSDYGMDADAFSVGATIRYMVTGVPPSVDVEDFIASRNNPLKKLIRSLKKRVKGGNNKRSKKFRGGKDLPAQVNDLVQILTHYNTKKRATVRSVTKHPWIKLAAADAPYEPGNEVKYGGPIIYLNCAQDK